MDVFKYLEALAPLLEYLEALVPFIALLALAAPVVVIALRWLTTREMHQIRAASPSLQPDLVRRALDRYGIPASGFTPKHKLQLAVERLAERRRRLTTASIATTLGALAVSAVLGFGFLGRGHASSLAVQSSAPGPAADAGADAQNDAGPASNSAPVPETLLFTLLSVKPAPGAKNYTAFRLTVSVNGFRNAYPKQATWADIKDPQLPYSFPVDLESDYRVSFKGQLRLSDGTEHAYAPRPIDVLEWTGKDRERVYSVTHPLIITFRISRLP